MIAFGLFYNNGTYIYSKKINGIILPKNIFSNYTTQLRNFGNKPVVIMGSNEVYLELDLYPNSF